MIYELIRKNRTIRRYKQNCAPQLSVLKKLVSSAGLCASAANLQRLRYFLIREGAPEIYSMLGMGGYLPAEKKPTEKVRPTAYVVILAPEDAVDMNIFIDIGIAAEAITLTAAQEGLGTCMIRNFSKEKLTEYLGCNDYTPQLVIALGYADEQVRITGIDDIHGIKYYKDENDVNVVPKRSLEELIIGIK